MNDNENRDNIKSEKPFADEKNNLLDYFRFAPKGFMDLYDFEDFETILNLQPGGFFSTSRLFDLDRLLERDKLREKDGFPRKIKLGKLVKPSKDGKDKSVIIPSAAEEKLYHWNSEPNLGEGSPTGGNGDEKEGEVIGEEQLRPDEGEGEGGAGKGEGGDHGMGADAFEIGRILTEQFELPNIKDKGKKTALARFTYDLTDVNRGHGQILDKKATLKRIVKTNLATDSIDMKKEIDTSKFIVTPRDRVYRTLSREKDYESQAIVFFVRDYSGSMQGKPTEAIVTQHVYIHSWLVYQYQRRVISRFIVHDTEAAEVPDFYTYYNKNVAGGTNIVSGYALVNKIVKEENLAKDYNIYIFHGTDGDDSDDDGGKPLEELSKMIDYANRIGITIAENSYTSRANSIVEKYLKRSKMLEAYSKIIHLDSFKADEADEQRLIGSIKVLIS
jgi:uncharacterized sporulation protein YeaH/YhbH (DUF444 family)